MPFNPDTTELDSSLLCDFLTECHLPETLQIVEGYDSNESEARSWSEGQILTLHSMKELAQVIGRDSRGNSFTLPLNYPEKIFESIPNRCRDLYKTTEELIADFPKYIRSLRAIPQCGVKVGDILCLLEASPNAAGCMELKCKLEGKTGPICFPSSQVGLFETLGDINPLTLREISERHLFPTRVRVRADASKMTHAFADETTNRRVMLEGLLYIEERVQEKVLIASTLNGKELRVVKLPIDLEVRVKREISKLDPTLFSEMCGLIDNKVDIESTITSWNRNDASWLFYIDENTEAPPADDEFDTYDEIRPTVPSRSPLNTDGSIPDKKTTSHKTDGVPRYVPSPKPKSPRHGFEVQKGSGKPLVAKKPNAVTRKSFQGKPPPLVTASELKKHIGGKSPKKTTSPNIESHDRSKEQEATSNYNELDESSIDKRYVGGALHGSSTKQKPETKPVSGESSKPVLPALAKPKPNAVKPKSPEGEQSPRERKETFTSLQNTESQIEPKSPGATSKCNTTEEVGMAEDTSKGRLQDISVSEVSQWLITLGLSQYVNTFANESVDGTLLLELDTEMMQHLGITNPLHKRKLMMFIQKGWIPKL